MVILVRISLIPIFPCVIPTFPCVIPIFPVLIPISPVMKPTHQRGQAAAAAAAAASNGNSRDDDGSGEVQILHSGGRKFLRHQWAPPVGQMGEADATESLI